MLHTVNTSIFHFTATWQEGFEDTNERVSLETLDSTMLEFFL